MTSESSLKFKSKSPRETSSAAKLFAEELLKTKPSNRALVIGLVGELGTGKTTFIKSFLRGLGVRARIASPTFILFRRYTLPGPAHKNVWHIDAYRIDSSQEFLKLGLTEIFTSPQNLVLVEWADKIKSILPKRTIWIKLEHGQKLNERHLTFNRR